MADFDHYLDNNGTALWIIHYIVVYYPLLWLLSMVLAVSIRFSQNHVTILEEHLEQKTNADKYAIDEL